VRLCNPDVSILGETDHAGVARLTGLDHGLVVLLGATLLPNPASVTATTMTAGVTDPPAGGEDREWVRVRRTDGIVVSRRTGLKGLDRSIRAEAEAA
jgi:hypothetical protein